MNLLVALAIFILLWWALLATIFSFQMHKANEDYARRLGERLPVKEVEKPNYSTQLSEPFTFPEILKSLKLNLNRLNLDKILRLVPLKLISK
jgi:hypothetical protein